MDFYTGKPDRPIEHYGVVSHSYQEANVFQEIGLKRFTQAATNLARSLRGDVAQQSDEDALQVIEQLILQKNSNANVVYDMKFSIAYAPVAGAPCMITKIYASYGCYKD